MRGMTESGGLSWGDGGFWVCSGGDWGELGGIGLNNGEDFGESNSLSLSLSAMPASHLHQAVI